MKGQPSHARPGGHGWAALSQLSTALICAAAPVAVGRVFPAERSYRRPTRREGVLLKFPFKNPRRGEPRSSRRAHRFKTCSQHGIAGSILRRRLLSASALLATYEPASATALCRCQTTWVSQSSPRPWRARARLAATRRTSRRTAGASHAQDTRAGSDSTEGAGFAGKLAFPQG